MRTAQLFTGTAYVQRRTGTSHIIEEDNGVKMEVWRTIGE
jgi:hypothetical protein